MLKELEKEKKQQLTDRSELVEEVYDLIGNPLSVYAVAATIESLGVRDIDAQNDFGYNSVFDLAEQMYSDLKIRVKNKATQHSDYSINLEKSSLKKRCWMFIKHYSQGLTFSLPMLSQIAAIIFFRYALWVWLEFNEAQATVVALGTIAAFIVTGGFIQMLGRSVTTYISENNYLLALESSKKIMNSGVLTTVGIAILFYLFNLIIPFYPQSMFVLGLVYFVLIGLLLLTSGILYALEQRMAILIIFVIGTAVVVAGMDVFNIGIYFSQWFGLTISIVLLASFGYFYLRMKVRFNRQGMKDQSLPNPGVRYYLNYRYFIYGFTYFFFLFLDRILAWSAGPPAPPYIIWFNTPYELGMDWALFSLILTIAVLEYSINAFSQKLMPVQKNVLFNQADDFNSYFKDFYWRQIILLLAVGMVSIFVTYYGVSSLRIFQNDIPEIRDFFANPVIARIYWIASLSYLCMVIGLLHSLFFFTLHKPVFSMYSILGAFLVNFVVGFICSRLLGFQYATLGLMAGTLTFAIITGFIARSFFNHLDYYYYSAF